MRTIVVTQVELSSSASSSFSAVHSVNFAWVEDWMWALHSYLSSNPSSATSSLCGLGKPLNLGHLQNGDNNTLGRCLWIKLGYIQYLNCSSNDYPVEIWFGLATNLNSKKLGAELIMLPYLPWTTFSCDHSMFSRLEIIFHERETWIKLGAE